MAKNQPIILDDTKVCRVLMPSNLMPAFKAASERCGVTELHLIGGRGTPSIISGTEADIVALKLLVSPEVQFINYNKTTRRFG